MRPIDPRSILRRGPIHQASLRFARAALFVLGLLASGPVLGQEPPAAAAPASPPSSSTETQPSVSQIGLHAEHVAAQLRQMSDSLADTAVFSALESEVATKTHRIAQYWTETGRLLSGRHRIPAIESLGSAWLAFGRELENLSGRIEARVTKREAQLAVLTKLRQSWTASIDLAQKAEAPASVVERARATLAAIDATRPAIEQRRARVLVLQDEVTRSLQACGDALGLIEEARRQAIARLLVAGDPPVWRIGLPLLGTGPRLTSDLVAGREILRIYAEAYRGGFMATGLLGLGLILLFRRARARMASLSARDPQLAAVETVFRTPHASAIVLALVLSMPLRPSPPPALQRLTLVLGLVAALFVLRPLLAARFLPAVVAFAALFVLNLATEVLVLAPSLHQLLAIAELGATAVFLLWAAAQLRAGWPIGAGRPRLRAAARAVASGLALACAGGAGAAALGYVDLAAFLGAGVLYLTFGAFGLLGFRVAADGLMALALVQGPLARLRAVAGHRALVERRVRSVLDVLAVGLWIGSWLNRFGLADPGAAMLRSLLEARLHVGELDLSFGRVLGFVAVVIGAFLTTRVTVFALEEDVYSRMALPRGVPYALSTLTRYGLLLTGFLLALGTLGLDLTRITVLVSAFGIGIGFGLQQVMNNFVSGLILLFERPIQVGDSVQLDDLAGEVRRIGIRSSTLRTPEGADVIVPNAMMIAERVTNWTLSDRTRRVDLDIQVAYDADAARILALLVDVARRDSRVHSDPPPEALLVRFGESSAAFQLHIWTDDANWMQLRSDVGVALQRALREARSEGRRGDDPPC
jgi:small-conductance mechanosensitive channel